MAMVRQFFAFHGTLKFSMIGLGQPDEIEEITLRPEICWHDAVNHEADLYMKWPHSANVRISDLGRPMVLSFSERLVIYYTDHVISHRQSDRLLASTRRDFNNVYGIRVCRYVFIFLTKSVRLYQGIISLKMKTSEGQLITLSSW